MIKGIHSMLMLKHTGIFINPKRAKANNAQRKERERVSSTRRNQSRERGREAGRGVGEEGERGGGIKKSKFSHLP